MARSKKQAARPPLRTTTKKTPRAAKATAAKASEKWKLRLYVAGQTPKSIRAFANLRALCDQHGLDHYQIEVIDLLEHPDMARGDQIVAVPALVIKLPDQVRQIIGDLSDTDRVLVGLALQEVI